MLVEKTEEFFGGRERMLTQIDWEKIDFDPTTLLSWEEQCPEDEVELVITLTEPTGTLYSWPHYRYLGMASPSVGRAAVKCIELAAFLASCSRGTIIQSIAQAPLTSPALVQGARR